MGMSGRTVGKVWENCWKTLGIVFIKWMHVPEKCLESMGNLCENCRKRLGRVWEKGKSSMEEVCQKHATRVGEVWGKREESVRKVWEKCMSFIKMNSGQPHCGQPGRQLSFDCRSDGDGKKSSKRVRGLVIVQ